MTKTILSPEQAAARLTEAGRPTAPSSVRRWCQEDPDLAWRSWAAGAFRNPTLWQSSRSLPLPRHRHAAGWCHKISVSRFPVEKPRRVTVDRAWIDAFLGRADRDGLPHLAAAMLFMWQTGTRVSETAHLMPEHVDLSDRVVLLETTKNSQWERRHISHELMIRLANLPKRGGKPIFGYSDRFGIRNWMKAVCRRAGIAFVSPHQSGRHSFATNSLAMGATAKEVMDAGGWKTARMVLEIYAHANDAGRSIANRFDAELAQSEAKTSQPIDRKHIK